MYTSNLQKLDTRSDFWRNGGKRLFDVVGAVAGLTLFAIPMLLIMVAIRLSIGRPVLFRQARPGLNGEIFTMYKFRTMHDLRDSRGNLLPEEKRLTKIGRFLRKTSLDELPELFNVLKGEMSLVGPRPLLPRYLPYYKTTEQSRHSVRPGITGWAQINGRHYLNWDDRFALDVWYVENCSFLLDVRIIIGTVISVLARKGVDENAARLMFDLDVQRRERPKHELLLPSDEDTTQITLSNKKQEDPLEEWFAASGYRR